MLGYGWLMCEARTTVAMIGNPTSAKGSGAKIDEQVFEQLREAGLEHRFDVLDLTGESFEQSLFNARQRRDDYGYLVVVGGDGMIAVGANAIGQSGKPLGIVAIGSGNDFARSLALPINRVKASVDGIVGAIVRGSHIDVDMGHVTSLRQGIGAPAVDRYYAGMLSCGLDASINDRANRSHLPGGKLRYFAALLTELMHMKIYGYHLRAKLADGSAQEMDLLSPLLTVANSRHIGGGIAVSPYSLFGDGRLDLIWLLHMPNMQEIAQAIGNVYNGRLLSSRAFGWERVREIEISHAPHGEEPPVLMADGEYFGRVPVRVTVINRGLRVLVPPAVAEWAARNDDATMRDEIIKDGRDPETGDFVTD